KAVAQALRVPMIGISSLDLLAFPLRQSGREVVAVIDARKGELFSAFYRPVPGRGQGTSEPRCGSVDDRVGELMPRGPEVVSVGDGALRYRDEIVASVRCHFA